MNLSTNNIEPFKAQQIMDYLATSTVLCAKYTRKDNGLIDIELQGVTFEILREIEKILTK
jgi:hypothetical protein